MNKYIIFLLLIFIIITFYYTNKYIINIYNQINNRADMYIESFISNKN